MMDDFVLPRWAGMLINVLGIIFMYERVGNRVLNIAEWILK